MNDAVRIIEIRQSFKNGMRYLGNDLDIYRAHFFVDPIKRALVHELHTYADIWVSEVGAVGRDDVIGMALVHNLEFSEDLFPDHRFGINEDDLITKRHFVGCEYKTSLRLHGLKTGPTFFAIVTPVGTCCTFTTLPPFPCPNSCKVLKSASAHVSCIFPPLFSNLASAFDMVTWRLRRLLGLSSSTTTLSLSAGRSGFFFSLCVDCDCDEEEPLRNRKDSSGRGSVSSFRGVCGSWRALKLRL